MPGPQQGEVTAQQRVLYDCCSNCAYVYAVDVLREFFNPGFFLMKTLFYGSRLKIDPIHSKTSKKIDVRQEVFVESEHPLVLIYIVDDTKSIVVYDADTWVLCWLSRVCSQREGDKECLHSF